MNMMLSEAKERLEPTKVAPATYLIRETQQAIGQPLSVYLNSALILGEEPVIVDTGTAKNRQAWTEQVFSLVDPADVRWVFLSHDDADHTGNLAEVMDACRNATLVCSWPIVERFGNAYDFPLHRCRWVNDGEGFVAGDRTLVAVRPPLFDSPTTRGLLDTSTGVYWAADTFATAMPGGPDSVPATYVQELDHAAWSEGMIAAGLLLVAPWLSMVDKRKFADHVAHVRDHGMSTVISAHSPVIGGDAVPAAFDMLGRLADSEAPPPPDQSMLDALLGVLEAQ